MQNVVALEQLGAEIAKNFVRPNPLAQAVGYVRRTSEKKEIDVEVCKELVRRQLIADGMLSRSIFFGSWQIIFWPRKTFFSKGSWPLLFRTKVFNFWIVGPFEIRHYL